MTKKTAEIIKVPASQKSVPAVTEVVPFGSTILIEHLTSEEVMGTKIWVKEETQTGSAPQAYIVALGPKLDKDVGLKVGDRVVVQGNFIPVENYGKNKHRKRGIVEIHNIKAILTEK